MTTNHLNQYHYGANAVLADVGWISDKEKADIADILTDGVVHFSADSQQLHLYWPMIAETMSDALDEARVTLRAATDLTGVVCPRTRLFQVAEIGQ